MKTVTFMPREVFRWGCFRGTCCVLFLPLHLKSFLSLVKSVDSAEVVHAICPVVFEVFSAAVLGSLRTLETMRLAMVAHDERRFITSEVDSVVMRLITFT